MRTSSGSPNGDDTIQSRAPSSPPIQSSTDPLTDRVHLFGVEWTDGPMDRNAIEAIIGLTNEFTQQYDLALQFFRRDSISGEEHVLSALLHALRAEAEERSRTRETSLDVLRYAAGERQIRSAIASTGLQIGLITYLCMVFIPAEGQPDVGNTTIRDTAFAFLRGIGFEITDMHPSCQGALLASLERTALVDLKL